jgi:hypothetical protein
LATLTQSTQSLIDAFKGVDAYGHLIDTIEMLNTTSQNILDDWAWMECNGGTKHTRSIRTGLPTVAWTSLYEGIPQSKSAKQQVDDTTGMVEGLSTIDERQLALYAENAAALRDAEAMTFMESLSQELLNALFYYNPTTNVKYPKGLGARYNATATSGAGAQIVLAGGAGSDNTSIWFVEHGYSGLSVIYPKGTVGGIQRENMGRQRVLDGSSNPYYVQEEKFSVNVGFSLGDWQRCARIANIDVSDMQAGSVKLYDFMRKAYYKLKSRRIQKVPNQASPGRLAIYCNKDVLEALDRLANNQGAADNFTRLVPMEIQGQEVLTYRGIPIRETDVLLNSETLVS